MVKAYLCVGGPEDGYWTASEMDRFQVPICQELSAVGLDSEEPKGPVPFKTVWYFEREFRFMEGTIKIWTPEGVSAYQALQALIEGYQPKEEP